VEPLVASGFVPYYSYTGNLAVTGRVGPVVTMGVTQTFSYSLANVDALCSAGAGSAANSCGIHIHTGTSCTNNALGHYFTDTVTNDPWTAISYTSLPDGTTSGTAAVTTGALASNIEGRAFIVHGFDGGRIACAILQRVVPMSPSMPPSMPPSTPPSMPPSMPPFTPPAKTTPASTC